ncbi:10976_t:CDS:2 [Ambispora gerdemannii]|uniref:10976_t:CDS:1 n=1 Tax=Ambispora gerdemannii TaxID=144530 RepID=A0A9N8YWT8_9GLOM|nr:10976_t:CDS:2 [Ambispora gerdemannii]
MDLQAEKSTKFLMETNRTNKGMEYAEILMSTDRFNGEYHPFRDDINSIKLDNTSHNYNLHHHYNNLNDQIFTMNNNIGQAQISRQSPPFSEPSSTSKIPFHKMYAACSGAILTSIFTTPLDVIKTRLQSQNNSSRSFSTSIFGAAASVSSPTFSSSLTKCCRNVFFTAHNIQRDLICRIPNQSAASSSLSCAYMDTPAFEAAYGATSRQLNGILDGVVKIVRYEGITSLWRGLSPALVMSVPSTVIYFVGYEHLRDTIWSRWKGKKAETYAPLIAGACARTTAVAVISPIELFRTRLQGPEGKNGVRVVMNGVKSMVRSYGIKSLWRGLGPTLWRDVPFSAIYWTGYESIKRNISDSSYMVGDGRGELHEFKVAFISGALSGMIAATLTTPFDVAKTRRQVASHTNAKNNSMLRIMQNVVKEEGFSGLMRGAVPRIGKVAPACAIMISSYVFFTSPRSSSPSSSNI